MDSFQLRYKLLTFIVRTDRSTRTVWFARDVETSEAFHQNIGAQLCVAVLSALAVANFVAGGPTTESIRFKPPIFRDPVPKLYMGLPPLLAGVRYDK